MLDATLEYLNRAAQSDFFLGGLALGAVGTAYAVVRVLWGIVQAVAARQLWVSVVIDNRTDAHLHFATWLETSGALSHAKRLRIGMAGADSAALGPDQGRHWFWRDGHLCRLDRDVTETKIGPSQKLFETFTVRVLLGRADLVQAWIDHGAARCAEQDRIGPGIHALRHGYWDKLGDVPRRGIATVLADDDRVTHLLDDVRWFYAASNWYAVRGVPWRRGYLLYGPPGTGKTSAIRAVASELGLDIATLDLSRAGLTDDELVEGLQSAPRDCVLAIEDIDAVFTNRTGERTGVSFSGLLNAIDGVAAQEGRALFMTTNHRERLDPALIRPGRADLHVELGPVGPGAAKALFARFFPEHPGLAEQFGAALGGIPVTPAALQGWLLAHATDPKAAAQATGLTARPAIAAE